MIFLPVLFFPSRYPECIQESPRDNIRKPFCEYPGEEDQEAVGGELRNAQVEDPVVEAGDEAVFALSEGLHALGGDFLDAHEGHLYRYIVRGDPGIIDEMRPREWRVER